MHALPSSLLSLLGLTIAGSLIVGCAVSSPSGTAPQLQVVSATAQLMPPGSPMGHAQVVYTVVLTGKQNVRVVAMWRDSTRLQLESPKEGTAMINPTNTLIAIESAAYSARELQADRSLPKLTVADSIDVELSDGKKQWRLTAPVTKTAGQPTRPN